MTTEAHIRPGSAIPIWISDIERSCFGKSWGSVSENEHIWTNALVSFACWRVVPSIREAELLRIGVVNSLRRSGYGRAILRYSQSQMASFGIKTLLLEVRASNTVARSLYESEGWICFGLRRGYYNDGEDAVNYKFTMLHDDL